MNTAFKAEIKQISPADFASIYERIDLKSSVDMGDTSIFVGICPKMGMVALVSTFGGNTACISESANGLIV